MTSRVEIDLNDVDATGLTMAFIDTATGPLQKGRMVTAFEPEEGSHAPALVREVDEANGVAMLLVDWKALSSQPEVPIRRGFSQVRTSAAARASVVEVSGARRRRLEQAHPGSRAAVYEL
jgi:hypothetical protein